MGDNWIRIPKIGRVKARVHREIFGQLKSITIMRTMTGKYFASVLVEDGLTAPEKQAQIPKDGVIGIDPGFNHYLSHSNGREEDKPPHSWRE